MTSVARISPHLDIQCPEPLRNLSYWLIWRYEGGENGAKPRKVPYYAGGGRRKGTQGTPEDRARLVTASAALAAARRKGFDGVGIAILEGCGFDAVDFDDVVQNPEHYEQVSTMLAGTYAEFSPSGNGIRGFVRHTGEMRNLKSHARDGNPFTFETFTSSGFVTFTGNALPSVDLVGSIDGITAPSPDLLALYNARMAVRRPVWGPSDGASSGEPMGYTLEQLQEFLDALDPSSGHDTWLSIGMALHHETEGSEEGFEMWDAWSSTASNYQSREDCLSRWVSFRRSTGRLVTIRSVLKLAGQAGARVGAPVATADDFDAIEDTPEETALPRFERDKHGAIKPNINNLVSGVQSVRCCGVVVAYDEFRDEIMWGPGGTDGWQRFQDVDYTRIQMRLERIGFKPISKELLRAAIDEVARRNAFDSAIMWLREKVPAWDGTPRVEAFLASYWGVEDTPYTRAVSAYLWSAMAGRVLEPGCKADMVPIFIGAQGCGKSTGVASLAPTEEVFAEVSLHEKEDDLSRKLKGRLVVELGELRGLHTRELEAIKAWIVRRWETWVPKYKEFATHYARRCVFFGTTNQDQFLADSTGNRRWLPVRVGRILSFMGERDQLWAEAREIFLKSGVQFRGAEQLAGDAHDEHTISDPWDEAIAHWLETEDTLGGGKPGDRSFLTTFEVGQSALNLDLRRPEATRWQMRIGEILRNKFGYERKQKRVNSKREWVYEMPSPPVPTSSLPAERGSDGKNSTKFNG